MTSALRRYVGFDGQQVCVASEDPGILRSLENAFRRMLEPNPSHPITCVEIRRVADGYFVSCDETEFTTPSLDDLLFHLIELVVLRLIYARPDLIWLHAGAAARGDRAVLISGAAGRGKSTLTTSLCEAGWQFLTDDVAPLQPRTGKVHPFPQTPYFRPHPGREIAVDGLARLPKVEARIADAQICREALPLAAVVLPRYRPGEAATLTPCSPATAALELIQNCLNLVVHKETGFHRLCELVKPLPTYRLEFSSGPAAAQVLAEAHAGNFRQECREQR